MAKLIVWNLVTLDGRFEGPQKWDLGFHQAAWSDDLAALSLDFGARAGLLVFGRVTYEGMKAYWTRPEDEGGEEGAMRHYMNALPKLVGSRTLTGSDWTGTRVTADPVAELRARRAAGGKDILVFGSALLADSLLEAGLVDEVMLATAPVTLGAGTPFFKRAWRFDLLETRPLRRGVILARYAPAT